MKLQKLTLALAIAGVSAIATAAYADDTHNSGFFAGLEGGYNNTTLPNAQTSTDPDLGNISFSSKKYMFGVHGGYLFDMGSGFDIGPMLSINYYGPTTVYTTLDGNMHISDYSIGLQATGQYTWQSFFARGNFGESYFMMRSSPSSNSDEPGSSKNQWKPVAGLTLGYYFTPSLSANMFYSHVFGSSPGADYSSFSQPKMDSVGVGVEYAFGTIGGTAS